MVLIGKFNTLKIVRKASFGYYLDAETGKTKDDILLPRSNDEEDLLSVGDEVDAFIYKDSKDRLIATLKTPLATIENIAYLKVVSNTSFGSFIDIGLERDVLVPLSEQKYPLLPEKYYLFYIYLDKTNRIAATTDIDKYLLAITDTKPEQMEQKYTLGSEVTGIVYGFQTNDSAMIAVDNLYRGVILRNEYYINLYPGDELKLRIKNIYEDGKLSLTPRKTPKHERISLEESILNYLKTHNGFMPYNDKSSPEDIRRVFHESKNYFKNALGGLMKRNLITQNEKGTKLKKL